MTGSIVTIGRFDGVHVGHQSIIRMVVEKATGNHLRSVVLTFDRHPLKTLEPESHPEILTPTDLRVRLIKALGVDEVKLIKFDKRFSLLDPEAFLDSVVLPLNVKELIVGKDFKFGKERRGDIDFVTRYAAVHGFKLTIAPFLKINGNKVGSSKIRAFLKKGDIAACRKMLGRNPSLNGLVVQGESLGASLGFPTANLRPDPDLCLPKTGVYAGIVNLSDHMYRCLVNVGLAPTFHRRSHPVIEVHIPGEMFELYGKELLVELVSRIRDEVEFKDRESLIGQLRDDTTKLEDMIRL
jgi:riboflavin kinase/FMN adenylyltransferase